MKKRFIIISLILIIIFDFLASAEFQELFSVKLGYDKEKINLVNLSVTSKYFHGIETEYEGGYQISLINQDEQVIFEKGFYFPIEIVGTPRKLDKGVKTVYLPYSNEAEKIKIYSPEGKLVLEVDLKEFVNETRNGNKTSNYYIYLLVLAVIVVLTVIFVVLLKRRNKKHLTNVNILPNRGRSRNY